MKKFLIITHLTPKAKRTPLRNMLLKMYYEGLEQQTSKNWKALIIGEEEDETDNIKTCFVNQETNLKDKLTKLYERDDVKAYFNNVDYLIKLDDDDIISPTILDQVQNIEFDAYYDQYHTFYDILSGKTSQQERFWMPSTCILKKEWAMAKRNQVEPSNFYLNSVFYSNHAEWHTYFSGAQILTASKENPVYIRILSPTSITAGGDITQIKEMVDINFKNYKNYLYGFGFWNSNIHWFKPYYKKYVKIWNQFSHEVGFLDYTNKSYSKWQKVKGKIKGLLKKLNQQDS